MDQNSQSGQPVTPPATPVFLTTQPPLTIPPATIQYTNLPLIEQVFHESWILFKKTFWWYVLFIIIGVVAIALTAVILMAISFLGSNLMVPLMIFALCLTFLFFVFGMPLWTFLMVSLVNSGTRVPLWATIKKGKPFIFPLLLVTFLSQVIITAGYFVLIIPGIIFSVLFIFVPFIIILEDRKPMIEVLKRSYYLVKAHFWPLFLRLFIIFAVTFCISLVLALIPYVNFILDPIVSWFYFIWTFVLYQHVVKVTPESKEPVSFRRVWITTGIGLLIGGILIASLFIFYDKLRLLPALDPKYDYQKTDTNQMYLYPTLTPEENSVEPLPAQSGNVEITPPTAGY